MNLLVTGGAGFIGSNLIHHIIDKPEIRRLVNLDCLTYAGRLENLEGLERHPKYIFEKVDLRDKSAVLRRGATRHAITHVLHLAAESHVDRSITGPGRFHPDQHRGNVSILEAVRAAWGGQWAGKRFHHVSTDEVYGSLGPTGFLPRRRPTRPTPPIPPARPRAIFWCARITTPTGCRW
jgi:dTDP-glucose 4,6-dehydratase